MTSMNARTGYQHMIVKSVARYYKITQDPYAKEMLQRYARYCHLVPLADNRWALALEIGNRARTVSLVAAVLKHPRRRPLDEPDATRPVRIEAGRPFSPINRRVSFARLKWLACRRVLGCEVSVTMEAI
jgi:hypothetical protein